jgi:uncharacterized protein YhfF
MEALQKEIAALAKRQNASQKKTNETLDKLIALCHEKAKHSTAAAVVSTASAGEIRPNIASYHVILCNEC